MEVPYSSVYDVAAAQRNDALDKLAQMTAYAKVLEARIAELEKAPEEAPATTAENSQNVTQ